MRVVTKPEDVTFLTLDVGFQGGPSVTKTLPALSTKSEEGPKKVAADPYPSFVISGGVILKLPARVVTRPVATIMVRIPQDSDTTMVLPVRSDANTGL